MQGDDILRLSDSTGITLTLRRDASIESGGWMTSDNLSASADISISLVKVIRYAEKTGDWEGGLAEESDNVIDDPSDPYGVDDTPIDSDYHPSTDRSNITTFDTYESSPMMGALYSVLLVTILGAMWGRTA